jgi:nucleoredoxin
MDKILGKKVELLRKDGSAAAEVPSSARVIGLLFASSNAETAEFSARLAQTCQKTQEVGKLVYVVYIGLDADDAAVLVQMPDAFVALPQAECKDVRDKLWVDLQLTASPSLVLYDGVTGRLITKSGMKVVRDDPEGIKYPWVPQALDVLLGDVLTQGNGKV